MADEETQDEEADSEEEEEEGDKKKEKKQRQPQPRPIIINMPKKGGMNSAQQNVLAAFGVTMIALAVRHGTVAKLRDWAKKPAGVAAPTTGASTGTTSPPQTTSGAGPVTNSNLPGQGPNSNVA